MKDCVIGRQRQRAKEINAAGSILADADATVLKMPDDCKAFIGRCTTDVASLETGMASTIDDINGCIKNCFDNALRCTNNIKNASTDIVKAIEDVTAASNDCVPTTAIQFLQ